MKKAIDKTRAIKLSKMVFVTASVFLVSCTTIENPEDCDIRCIGGANKRFEAENNAMENKLDKIDEENWALSQTLNEEKEKGVALLAEEGRLKNKLRAQTVELNELRKKIDKALALKKIAKSEHTSLSAELVAMQTITDKYLSFSNYSPSENKKIAKQAELTGRRIVTLNDKIDNLNIVNTSIDS
ncbi:MAG: hypothetical protein COA91_13850 [Robiginitomaculum sp.]|nr:MAG: hypothetical protein COA91_13850 [Robiginitomaculum sp.]